MTRRILPIDIESLRAACERGERFDYLLFWGHRPTADGTLGLSVFSQWWPTEFDVDGTRYASAEHYMMAEKARVFDDQVTRQKILDASTPAIAKKLGRSVSNFDEPTWQRERAGVVLRGCIAKFGSLPELRSYLLATHDQILVEASPVDPIWGIGLAADHPDARNPRKWRGLNLLGFALILARQTLVGS